MIGIACIQAAQFFNYTPSVWWNNLILNYIKCDIYFINFFFVLSLKLKPFKNIFTHIHEKKSKSLK